MRENFRMTVLVMKVIVLLTLDVSLFLSRSFGALVIVKRISHNPMHLLSLGFFPTSPVQSVPTSITIWSV